MVKYGDNFRHATTASLLIRIHKLQKLFNENEFKCALDELGPISLYVIANISTALFECGLLNSMQYPNLNFYSNILYCVL